MKSMIGLCLAALAAGAPLQAQDGGMLVSGAWLARHAADTDLVVLHVARDRAEYDRAHVPGARFLSLGAIVTERDGLPNELPAVAVLDSVLEGAGVSDRSRVILYGDPLAAARAFFTLEYLGHTGAALLDGGLEAWQAEGRPVTSVPPPGREGRLTPGPRPELLAHAAWVRDHLENPAVALIDARPSSEFSGDVAGGGVVRPGHVPGATNLFWRDLLVPGDRPVLRPRPELAAMFLDAGAAAGDTVVAYCRTGVQASLVWFTARYLGYQARLYDGSFIEWSADAALPVARAGP